MMAGGSRRRAFVLDKKTKGRTELYYFVSYYCMTREGQRGGRVECGGYTRHLAATKKQGLVIDDCPQRADYL